MSTVMITGGHKGLGLQAAQQIAKGGFDLLLAGRQPSEIEDVAKRLRRDYAVDVRVVKLDVSSLASVREAAIQVKALLAGGAIAPLQALMCNAGAQFLRGTRFSVDGYEQTFATNCLGHFLLINLLLDSIEPKGRVVFTASGTHDPETMDGKVVGAAVAPDAMALAHDGKAAKPLAGGKSAKPLAGGKRYTTSKLCTLLYSYELDRRLKASGVAMASIAYDPGLIVETNLSLRRRP